MRSRSVLGWKPVTMEISALSSLGSEVQITAPVSSNFAAIVSADAINFLTILQRKFGARRKELLSARIARQARLDAGERPDFLSETKHIREGRWSCAPVPADLQDRRVEITGPVDRKMIINALNSGACVFMADFEDSSTPLWDNLIDGQLNLKDAIRRTIAFDDLKTGKHYRLNDETAVIFVRPRGWHMLEQHVLIDGEPMSASIFDFGLYFFHNAQELVKRGSGPYFYLPKMESHLEARLWNDIFIEAQNMLGLPQGSIRSTCLIETILATFEMDEILYELRDHSAGLNCGRWDYIFSFIKKLSADRSVILPDRSQITMTTHFMRSYSKLCIKTCHNRNIHAMGGMSAFIPIKSDPVANEKALAQVRADKEREALDGHDGTWVAHPGLVPVAMEVFNRVMPQSNQIDKKLADYSVTAADLLEVPGGEITEAGLRQNVAVGLGYVEAWLRGIGCVPLFNLMEDAATAEISRAQLWQWVHHGASLNDGRRVTKELCDQFIDQELAEVRPTLDQTRFAAYEQAASLMRNLIRTDTFVDFLTIPAYNRILKTEVFTAADR
jgi:malate synthase